MKVNRSLRFVMLSVLASIVLASGSGKSTWANEPPVAQAGLPRYAAQDSVRLDGQGSYDPDNSGPLTYAWTQVSGPPTVITGTDTATPTISGFAPTDQIQECQFQLIVNDGQQASLADRVKVVIVPAFADDVMTLESGVFDPEKPTIVFLWGAFSADSLATMTGGGRLDRLGPVPSVWSEKANLITFNPYRGYTHLADMVVVYLSALAPAYRQPIQMIGHSLGGWVALNGALRLNQTYADARYAVNRVTLLDSWWTTNAQLRANLNTLITTAVDGERCWVDSYVGVNVIYSPGILNVAIVPDLSLSVDTLHVLVGAWYLNSLTLDPASRSNNGLVAGAYWSVIGPGKNLQLALTPGVQTYKFRWRGDDQSGRMELFNAAASTATLPEPVTLIGPNQRTAADPNARVFSCQPSENAVGYQLLFGPDPDRIEGYHLVSDTPHPPRDAMTTLPLEETWWTARVRDVYGSTIHADPRRVDAYVLSLPIENIALGKKYGYLQTAIDEASERDVIVVGQGTCHENVDFRGKSLTLRSADPNDMDVVAATIIAGRGGTPVVTLAASAGAPPVLDGLTITGGTVGVACHDAAPTIRNCVVENPEGIAVEFWMGHEPRWIDSILLGQVKESGDPRLLAYWRLDETEGETAVDSAGGHKGRLYGHPVWQPAGGMNGGALALDGAGDYVQTPFLLDPASGRFSVFAWVQGGGPEQVIVSQADGAIWLGLDADGALMTTLRGATRGAGPLVSSAVITDGAWHRVGLIWDGKLRTLYVDTLVVARDAKSFGAAPTSGGGLYLGACRELETNAFWSGLIDDVRVYNRAVKP